MSAWFAECRRELERQCFHDIIYSELHQRPSFRTDTKESRYIVNSPKILFKELLRYFEENVFMQKTTKSL